MGLANPKLCRRSIVGLVGLNADGRGCSSCSSQWASGRARSNELSQPKAHLNLAPLGSAFCGIDSHLQKSVDKHGNSFSVLRS